MRYVLEISLLWAVAVIAAAADPWQSVHFDSAAARRAKGAAVVAPAAAAAPPLSPTDQPGVFRGSDGNYWAVGTVSGALCYWDGSQWKIWWKPPAIPAPARVRPICPTGTCPYRTAQRE